MYGASMWDNNLWKVEWNIHGMGTWEVVDSGWDADVKHT